MGILFMLIDMQPTIYYHADVLREPRVTCMLYTQSMSMYHLSSRDADEHLSLLVDTQRKRRRWHSLGGFLSSDLFEQILDWLVDRQVEWHGTLSLKMTSLPRPCSPVGVKEKTHAHVTSPPLRERRKGDESSGYEMRDRG